MKRKQAAFAIVQTPTLVAVLALVALPSQPVSNTNSSSNPNVISTAKSKTSCSSDTRVASTATSGKTGNMPSTARLLQNGITVSIGSPIIHTKNITDDGSSIGFVSLEEWPLVVFANSTTNVDLSTPDLPSEAWVKFVPSHVLNVGPDGANVTMLLAGAVRPFGNFTGTTMSLFIDARASNGMTGESILPIVGEITLGVLHSPGPINLGGIGTSGPGRNLTSYDVVGIVYDPVTGSSANQSVSVRLSVEGILQNGTICPLPTWIRVLIPQPSFVLNASQLFYFEVGATVPSVPEGGASMQYVVVLKVVGGQDFLVNLTIEVDAPMRL